MSSVSTLKPLLFQYSLYRFIAYSIAQSVVPTKVPPGADRRPDPLKLRHWMPFHNSIIGNFMVY